MSARIRRERNDDRVTVYGRLGKSCSGARGTDLTGTWAEGRTLGLIVKRRGQVHLDEHDGGVVQQVRPMRWRGT